MFEELGEIWDDADNNISDDFSWRTRDFAVLVEDDGEDASPTLIMYHSNFARKQENK